MSLSKAFSSMKSNLYHKYGENPGTMLLHTGTIGWILSCAAQMIAIATNDKIEAKEKAFLLPQELSDGVINILSFYILTSSVKNIASLMTKNGKIANKAIKGYLNKHGLADKIGKADFNISETKNFGEIKDEYISFKNGVDVLASTAGSVLSCNLVTPVLRNEFAARKQQELTGGKKCYPCSNVYLYNKQTMSQYLQNTGMKI